MRFQFRLTTLVALSLCAGLLLYLNLFPLQFSIPFETEKSGSPIYNPWWRDYGFPFTALTTFDPARTPGQSPNDLCVYTSHGYFPRSNNQPVWSILNLALNLFVAFALLATLALLSEKLLARRNR